MLIFKNFEELKESDVSEEIKLEVRGAIELNSIQPSESFISTLGGNINVIETLEDLKYVEVLVDSAEPSLMPTRSILEAVGDIDAGHYLTSRTFIFMLLADNNGGGTPFFIPNTLSDQVPNINNTLLHNDMLSVKSWRGPISLLTRISPVTGLIVSRYVPVSHDALLDWDAKKHDLLLTEAEKNFIEYGVIEEETSYFNHLFVD